MKILIADDEAVSRLLLQNSLQMWGYEVIATQDGAAAWKALQAPNAPRLAVLDWMMPGLDGVEVCRRLRANPATHAVYVLLITGRTTKEDIVAGLESGADDYIIKPFDRAELQARLKTGVRILELQHNLAERVRQLEDALAEITQLQGLIPICQYCKNVRTDQDSWQKIESYIAAHSDAHFSHGICPDCWKTQVQPQLDRLKNS